MNKQKIFCKICNEQTKMYSDSFGRWHLNRCHNITMREYYDKYIKTEKEGVCEVCGKNTKFISYNQGYLKHCSCLCAGINEKTIKKIKKTKKERYDDENFSNRKKATKTNIKKYGVENVSQIEEIKEQKKKTTFKNFGVYNPLLSEEIKEKSKQTCIKNYGVDNPSKSEKIKIKRTNTILKKYGVSNFSKSLDYRKLKEELGEWIPLEQKSDYEIYRMFVWKETDRWKEKLFKKWDGFCYYTGDKLIVDTLLYNDPLYATIDHKNSIYFGFKNNINPKEIGNIKNLCVCSRIVNTYKNKNIESEFKLKKK